MQPAEKVCEHPVTDILNLETDLNVSHVYAEVPAELGDEDPQEPGYPFGPGPIDPEKGSDLYPPLTPIKNSAAAFPTMAEVLANSYHPPPTAPLPKLPLRSHSHLTLIGKCREDALKRGDIPMLLAMWINYQPKKPSQYVQPPFELIKVCKDVQDYGLQTQYTMGLISSINQGYTTAPNDWRMFFKLILMSAQ